MAYFGAKQPYEEYFVRFDFLNYLGEEEISSALVIATDVATEEDATAMVTDSTKQYTEGSKIYVAVQGGEDGHSYRITCRITGTEGSKYELDGILPVKEG